ncbi:morphogenic membrane protein MmpA [Streptomyces sp. NPDC004285]
MTTPRANPPRSDGHGLTPVLAASVALALAWTCAILYVLVRWTLG